MRAPANCLKTFAPALVLLGLHALGVHGSRAGSETAVTAAPAATDEVCESRTINYITHSLPQQCLRTSWTSPSPAATDESTSHATTITATATAVGESPATDPDHGTAQDQAQDTHEELAASSFMSFEEWKEMMLRKSGQDPANIRSHRQREHRDRDPSMQSGDVYSFGEEGEISLEFDALAEKVSEIASSTDKATPKAKEVAKEEQVLYDDGKTQYYRSKDAGKTCKERFSYSSFDAGATVLKTSPGAKNAKAILVENKDSYMLLECRAKNKFVIVELSDDILVDTVVLANFEFFSSMIRKFRVSVSDRYPVKMDKWVELGTFEARNSRDMQAFLIEHPQIYTKYIRIEFLSYWGNEFYCPISLLRVHGTRMLDTWKEPSHDDEPEQIEPPPGSTAETQQVQKPAGSDNTSVADEEKAAPRTPSMEMGLTPWPPLFQANFSLQVCELPSPTAAEPTPINSGLNGLPKEPAAASDSATPRPSAARAVDERIQASNSSPPEPVGSAEASASHRQSAGSASSGAYSTPSQASNNGTVSSTGQRQSDSRTNATDNASSATPTTPRNKTSSASSASASPTVQESFFKAITKRLQLLESNTSLSLQYIEEQSRFLQEVLLKMERKQITRVDSFLDTLNKTVLSELRNVRTQYDQIWQSTVLALETQREQSQREIVALTSRLNVLADEVVFQKRMAILQSVLLLSCLVLVIFSSRGGLAALDSAPFPPPWASSPTAYRRYGHAHSDSFSGMSMPGSPPLQGQQTGGAASPPIPTTSAFQRQTYPTTTSYKDKSLPLTPPSEYSRESTPATHPNRTARPSYYYSDNQEEGAEGEGEEGEEGDEAGGEGGTASRQFRRHVTARTTTPPAAAGPGPGPGPGPSAQAAASTAQAQQTPSSGGDAEVASIRSDPGLLQRDDAASSISKGKEQQGDDDDDEEEEEKGGGRGSPVLLRARSVSSHSASSQPNGGLRKPLPALPEDPS
ncbi:UNC-like C-terminal-domain-containing protein [Thermothelomyces heterothallicus CBS 202.75]|uniref:UNC-like C-terminal-domain-containing protein n=1 Tax=Thermothelomyces heterothallicus CBS 202.75 TaxID=1149848 RepID=UPI003742C690